MRKADKITELASALYMAVIFIETYARTDSEAESVARKSRDALRGTRFENWTPKTMAEIEASYFVVTQEPKPTLAHYVFAALIIIGTLIGFALLNILWHKFCGA
jgi:hypothetical protein